MSDEGLSDRTERILLFLVGLPKNRWLLAGIGLAVLIQLAVVYAPPLQRVFYTVPLSAGDWVLVLLIASSIPANERLCKAVAPRHLEQRRIVELQECPQGR